MPPGTVASLARHTAIFVLSFLLTSINLAAQDPAARFTGTVTDEFGTPVEAVEVRVLLGGGRLLDTITGTDGNFAFEIDEPFQLEVTRPGFRSVRTTVLSLTGGETYQISFVLLSGDPSDVEVVELQLSEPIQFSDALIPFVRDDLPRSDRLFGLRGGLNVSGIAEGSSQQWIAASGSVFASSPSATVLIEPFDLSAEFTSNMGVDDSLPAGGARFNGNAYYFHLNDALNARNFFDLPDEPIPPFKYHFFGSELGGPIGDRTFVFGRYWGLRVRQSVTRAATVPPPAWVGGDFSSLPDPILDPETGFPFPGNRIPVERLHANGVQLAGLFPEPNVGGTDIQNFRTVGTLKTVADAFGIRVDHRMTVSDETSIEYQYSRDTTQDPFNFVTGITNLPGFGVRDSLETQTLRIGNAHVFSPTLFHQFGFSLGYLEQPRQILTSLEYPAVIITGFSNVGHATNLPQERRNRTIEFTNDFSWIHGGATTQIGSSVRHFSFDAFMDLFSRSQFQFNAASYSQNSFANLLLGLPANAIRIEGDTAREFDTWTTGAYVQHEWSLGPGLDVNVGLRYDYQSPFGEAQDRVANFTTRGTLDVSPDRLYGVDANNWSPRVGVAWSPLANTVVRAGYGIFYDNLVVGDSLFLLGLNPPFVSFEVENNDPVLPRFDLGTVFEDPSNSIPPSVFSASTSLRNPYVQHWNLIIGRTLFSDYDLTLSYIGQKGTHLRRQVNLNQPTPGPAVTLEERRPFPDFANVFQFETSASSIAHAGDVSVVRRFARGMGFRASYRLARMIDDATLISILPQNSRDLRSERGLADFHVKHSFSLTGALDLPYLGGWQLQGVGLFRSGTPLSAILSSDVAGTGSPIVNRPNLVGDPRVDNPTPARFFNTDAFEVPEPGQFGDSGRNVIIGPGLANVDFALRRTFRLSDEFQAEFRADFYNAFNHPNFVAPPTTQNFADSPEFGALFVARSPRTIQLGMTLFW